MASTVKRLATSPGNRSAHAVGHRKHATFRQAHGGVLVVLAAAADIAQDRRRQIWKPLTHVMEASLADCRRKEEGERRKEEGGSRS